MAKENNVVEGEIVESASSSSSDEGIKAVLNELSRLRKEVDQLRQGEGEKPSIKARYGVRIAMLENGTPHYDVFHADGETVTYTDLGGLADWFQQELRFIYWQSAAARFESARRAAQEKEEAQDDAEDKSD